MGQAPARGTVLAVDVGGTSIKAALFDVDGVSTRFGSVTTPVREGGPAVARAVVGLARRTADASTLSATVALPGVVDSGSGIAGFAANLGWLDVPLAAMVSDELGIPVFLDRDSHAAGVAEQTSGAARGVADCLLLVIGTGISATVVSEGVRVRGARELAGELGHLAVVTDGEQCGCGQRGCLEVYSSAAGIARRFTARTGRELSSAEIVGLTADDPDAYAVWHEGAQALGAGLAAATVLLDPALIVLAGGLADAGPALQVPVAEALTSRLGWRPAPPVTISPLGATAGLVGAAHLAWQRQGGVVASQGG